MLAPTGQAKALNPENTKSYIMLTINGEQKAAWNVDYGRNFEKNIEFC